jgi:hypothetical protein
MSEIEHYAVMIDLLLRLERRDWKCGETSIKNDDAWKELWETVSCAPRFIPGMRVKYVQREGDNIVGSGTPIPVMVLCAEFIVEDLATTQWSIRYKVAELKTLADGSEAADVSHTVEDVRDFELMPFMSDADMDEAGASSEETE